MGWIAPLETASIKQESLASIIDNSLLVGNGDLHGVIHSTSDGIVVRVVKNDIYDARIDTSGDPELLQIDVENRVLSRDVNLVPKSWKLPYPCPVLCAQIIISIPRKTPTFLERVKAWFSKASPAVSCRSILDISRAVATLTCDGECGEKTIQVRVLAGKNAILINTDLDLSLTREDIDFLPSITHGSSGDVEWITQVLPGDDDWPGMEYTAALAQKENVAVITIVNSLESSSWHEDAIKEAGNLVEIECSKLIKEHESTWAAFWQKSGILLEDEFLTRCWYQNLYFLRCIAKKGVKAAGLYAGYFTTVPMWHGAHTLNYNSEQTFWAAYSSNHVDLGDPYEQMILQYLPRARYFAKETYGFGGAHYPHNVFTHESIPPAECKSRLKRMHAYAPYAHTIGVTGHVVHNLWQHYLLFPDRGYLEGIAYPVIREAADFYSNFIERCKKGEDGLVELGPSYSPEHWRLTPDFKNNFNCTYDIAFIQYTLEAAMDAGAILGEKSPVIERWGAARKVIPVYPTFVESTGNHAGSRVIVDVKDATPIEYNITVPTIPIFPANQVTYFSAPEQKDLFERTVRGIKWNGNNSMIMLAVARARLSMEGASDWLVDEMRARRRPNGTLSLNRLSTRNNFNLAGHYSEQFAVVGAINELLLQGVGGIIRVFAAWPAGLGASFRQLRAQGGFIVSASKLDSNAGDDAGTVSFIEVTATVPSTMRLLSPWKVLAIHHEVDPVETVEMGEDMIFSREMAPGETITLKPS
ncbi:MAG: glycosyl hydrolase family 95 catalytic domain-containing protein [Promethearchaeota archaeon]